jgi:hypothetical protein
MNRLIAFVVLIMLTTGAVADQHKAGEMTAEEKAMMEAMMAIATPGEPHKRMAQSVGSWEAQMLSWGQPGAEPTVSTMKVERQMQLDGRVLEERWTGAFMGTPFNGYSRTGYDNREKRYWTTWTDNMSTGLFISYGEWDKDSGKLIFVGDAVDPVTGETIPTRSEVTYMEDGSEAMQMYQGQDGEEFKSMEFTLVRK